MSVSVTTTTRTTVGKPESINNAAKGIPLLQKLRNPSELQLKLERQLQKSRAVKAHFKSYTSRNILSTSQERAPLVSYDASEDDFEDINLKVNEDDDEKIVFKQPRKNFSTSDVSSECHEHLLKDGFRLDEISDDEDLDLIPPKPPPSLWCACQATSCNIL